MKIALRVAVCRRVGAVERWAVEELAVEELAVKGWVHGKPPMPGQPLVVSFVQRALHLALRIPLL